MYSYWIIRWTLLSSRSPRWLELCHLPQKSLESPILISITFLLPKVSITLSFTVITFLCFFIVFHLWAILYYSLVSSIQKIMSLRGFYSSGFHSTVSFPYTFQMKIPGLLMCSLPQSGFCPWCSSARSFILCFPCKLAAGARCFIRLGENPFEKTIGGAVFLQQQAHNVWFSFFLWY